MSKFAARQTPTATTSPVVGAVESDAVTYERGLGYTRDPKSELFLLAVSNMVGQDTFYEGATERDERFRDLVWAVTVEDPDWVARFVPYLRDTLNMRSASVVMALESAKARLNRTARAVMDQNGVTAALTVRQMVDGAMQRADEPAEALAYWFARYGRDVPMAVKRGIGDAARRLYNEYSALKYNSPGHSWRMADVLELTHPRGENPAQDALFTYLLDERHDRSDARVPAELLPMIDARRLWNAIPQDERRDWLRRAEAENNLKVAGVTWESLSGWLNGPMDAAAWETVIPSMGYMALLRNLRNFDQAGVSNAVAGVVAARLLDPEQVARSRQFPFRFLSAYQAVNSERWGHALEETLQLSLANVPVLPGRTLVLVDRSGSMTWENDKATSLVWADMAAVFGSAVAMRAVNADLVQFGTGSAEVPFSRGESLLRVTKKFGDMGGTNTESAVRRHYAGHDRVVVVTDEQTWEGAFEAVPAHVPTYTWNFVGYRVGHAPSGSAQRHVFGGLSDAAFRLIPLLESGRSQGWPF